MSEAAKAIDSAIAVLIRLRDWQREVCDLFGYGPEDAK